MKSSKILIVVEDLPDIPVPNAVVSKRARAAAASRRAYSFRLACSILHLCLAVFHCIYQIIDMPILLYVGVHVAVIAGVAVGLIFLYCHPMEVVQRENAIAEIAVLGNYPAH